MLNFERKFFRKMRKDVTLSVKKYGLENIIGWRVTEKGISAVIKSDKKLLPCILE